VAVVLSNSHSGPGGLSSESGSLNHFDWCVGGKKEKKERERENVKGKRKMSCEKGNNFFFPYQKGNNFFFFFFFLRFSRLFFPCQDPQNFVEDV